MRAEPSLIYPKRFTVNLLVNSLDGMSALKQIMREQTFGIKSEVCIAATLPYYGIQLERD